VRNGCLLAAFVGVLALAGCGSPPHYALAPTRTCLQQDGARIVAPRNDFVAQTATSGAFRAWLSGTAKGNAVTISFGSNADDAKNIADGYLRFHAKNVGVSDILYTDKNVVLLFREHPSDADLSKVRSCLK
jgi:hypothetical protein